MRRVKSPAEGGGWAAALHLCPITGIARYIEVTERQRLLGELRGARDQLLAVLGLNTGLRVGSILSLRWKQVWRGGGPVPVLEVPRRNLKGGRSAHRRRVLSRRVPVNAVLAEAARAYVAEEFGGCEPDEEAFVFASVRRGGAPLTRQQAYNIISRAAARAGLQGTVAPHGLRRSFAGDVYEATGHDLVATQLLLGHSSPLVTAAYLRPREDELDAVVLNLPATGGGLRVQPPGGARLCISRA